MSLKILTAVNANVNCLKYYFLQTCTNILCSYNELHMECVISTTVLQLLAATYIAITRTPRNDENQEGAKWDEPPRCWRW